MVFAANSVAASSACPPSEEFLLTVWDDCFGTLVYEDGETYQGWWKLGVRHGKGTFIFGDKGDFAGQKYEGEWRLDKFEGQGTLFMPNGDKYIGEFQNGKIHGYGELFFSDKTSVYGVFRNGKFIPHICEGMGLDKKGEAYQKCVLRLLESVLDSKK
jgi:hypothetical protein